MRFRFWILAALWLTALCNVPVHCVAEEQFGGVGLQVVPTAGGELVVLRVVEDSPAAGRGLRPGDLITRVGDLALAGSDFTDVVTGHLWGPVGTSVTLHYLRPGVEGEHSVILLRVELQVDPGQTPGVRMLAPEK